MAGIPFMSLTTSEYLPETDSFGRIIQRQNFALLSRIYYYSLTLYIQSEQYTVIYNAKMDSNAPEVMASLGPVAAG
jgi:hypothetical protein